LTPEAAQKLQNFFGAFQKSHHPFLLLDYDGTLAPFRVDRFTAIPWAGVRPLLQRIQDHGHTRMAVVTGRPAHEIAPLLQLNRPLEVWGLHGAERLYPDGRRELEQAPPATQARLDELKQHLRRDSFGGLFEDKANGAVMHWRGLPRKKAEHVEQRTRALFEPLSKLAGLTLLDFEAGLELRTGRDKGAAIEAILAETDSSGPVGFLGDDLTDEAGFSVVNHATRPHLSVLVRRSLRETAADVWLCPPQEVVDFLRRWIEAEAR
jgi:trehalose 6-phosphate phosphatase